MNHAIFPATTSSEWSSPCGPSDFIWPDPIVLQTSPPPLPQQQQQQYNITASPHQQQDLNSMLAYHNMSNINNNNPQPTYIQQPPTQQQQSMNVNIHTTNNAMNSSVLNPNLCYSSLSNSVVNVLQHAYYPN